MMYVGIDVHKKVCVACLQDEKGQVIKEVEFENKEIGFQLLLESLKDEDVKAVMESTGNLWKRLYRELETSGVQVMLANTRKTRVIAEARISTDRICAKTLTDLLRADLIAPCYVPPAPVMAVRALLRHRITLVRDRTQVKNRIHSLLDNYELPEFEGTDLFGKGGMEWLEQQLPELGGYDQFILQEELYQLRVLDQLIEEVEQKITTEVEVTADVSLLMSLTGVSFFIAVLFLYEVGDIKRFPSASNLVSWIGMAPSTRQSGETCYHGSITKRGTPLVRWALVQAAQVAVRFDPYWKVKFHRIAARRGKQKAYVAIARELVVAMYCMLTRGEPYHHLKKETHTRKLKNVQRQVRKAQTNQRRSTC